MKSTKVQTNLKVKDIEEDGDIDNESEGRDSDHYDEDENDNGSDDDDDVDEEDDDEQDDDGEVEDDDDDDDDENNETELNQHNPINEDAPEYTYDLYNLSVFSYNPIQINIDTLNEDLHNIATAATQHLVTQFFQLPPEPTDVGPVVKLPTTETMKLPREKRIPEPKPMTKWEKFAKQKGILKQKKDRMLYDEETGEYRPRFGYKSNKNNMEDIPIMEVKPGQDPYADPWAEIRSEKKQRITKNLNNQMKNQLRVNGKNAKKLSYDPSAVPGVPIDLENKQAKRGKDGVRRTLQLVQHSTASLGRFDEMRPHEPERKIKGKKRSYRDNLTDNATEKAVMKAQLRIVDDKIDKKRRGITNSLAAYEGILPDAPTDSFKSKKGKSSSSSGSKSAGKSVGKSTNSGSSSSNNKKRKASSSSSSSNGKSKSKRGR